MSTSAVCRRFVWAVLVLLRFSSYQCADPPKIKPFSFQSHVKVGDRANVACFLLSSEAPVSFKWLLNGHHIVHSQEIKIKNDTDFSIIIIDPVGTENAGNYSCVATNVFGSETYSAVLSVTESPKWIKEPLDTTVVLHDKISLHCSASGVPVPKITWRVVQGPSQNLDIYRLDDGTLRFGKVQKEHEGIYECEADNGVAPVLRKSVQIKVTVPARFEEKFTVVTSRKGESARLRCEALGDQPLSVTWSRDQVKLSKTGDSRYEIFETLMSKGIVSELIIRSTDREDGGLYACLAENEYGKDERKTRLLVMETPAPPLDVKIREVWSRSASVSWSSPYSGNSPITKYILQYWRDHSSPHRLNEISAPSSQSSALIKDLHPGTPYILKIVAENAVGRGIPSEGVKFHTGEEEPGAPPVDIVVEARGSSTIRVAWKPPPKDSWNGQLKGYLVGYKTRDSAQPYSYKTVEYTPDVEQEYFLTNLLKATEYIVVVKAFNSAGGGPASHEMIVRTFDGDLPQPPNLFVLSTSHNSVSLRWTSRKSEHPITGFTVHFREELTPWQEVAIVAPDDNTYTLNNLQGGKMYQIYVTATNQFGRGDPSEIVAVKTKDPSERRVSTTFGPNGSAAYMDVAVLVPVAASVLTIFVVVLVACICVKKIRSRQNIERALAAEKHLAMVGTVQRYVDIDKARPLVAIDPNSPDHYPSPYATIPMQCDPDMEIKDALNQELKTFFPKDIRDRPLPYPKPNSLKRKGEEHIYDLPQ